MLNIGIFYYIILYYTTDGQALFTSLQIMAHDGP